MMNRHPAMAAAHEASRLHEAGGAAGTMNASVAPTMGAGRAMARSAIALRSRPLERLAADAHAPPAYADPFIAPTHLLVTADGQRLQRPQARGEVSMAPDVPSYFTHESQPAESSVQLSDLSADLSIVEERMWLIDEALRLENSIKDFAPGSSAQQLSGSTGHVSLASSAAMGSNRHHPQQQQQQQHRCEPLDAQAGGSHDASVADVSQRPGPPVGGASLAPALLVVSIEVRRGVRDDVVIREGDSCSALAMEFTRRHALALDQVWGPLTQFLQRSLDEHLQRVAEEAVQRDQQPQLLQCTQDQQALGGDGPVASDDKGGSRRDSATRAPQSVVDRVGRHPTTDEIAAMSPEEHRIFEATVERRSVVAGASMARREPRVAPTAAKRSSPAGTAAKSQPAASTRGAARKPSTPASSAVVEALAPNVPARYLLPKAAVTPAEVQAAPFAPALSARSRSIVAAGKAAAASGTPASGTVFDRLHGAAADAEKRRQDGVAAAAAAAQLRCPRAASAHKVKGLDWYKPVAEPQPIGDRLFAWAGKQRERQKAEAEQAAAQRAAKELDGASFQPKTNKSIPSAVLRDRSRNPYAGGTPIARSRPLPSDELELMRCTFQPNINSAGSAPSGHDAHSADRPQSARVVSIGRPPQASSSGRDSSRSPLSGGPSSSPSPELPSAAAATPRGRSSGGSVVERLLRAEQARAAKLERKRTHLHSFDTRTGKPLFKPNTNVA